MSIGGREDDIRRWVAEGRTDEWMARRLGTHATVVAAFRWEQSLYGPKPAASDARRAFRPARRFAADASRRDALTLIGGAAPATFERLSQRSRLSTSAVRYNVFKLEEKGLVEVRKARVDGRRRSVVVLTGAGEEIVESVSNGGEETP